MEILGKLFGSDSRVKIIRLFLMNPDSAVMKEDVSKKSRISKEKTSKEIRLLKKIGFLSEKKVALDSKSKKKVPLIRLNYNFPYLHGLKELLIGPEVLKGEDLLRRLTGVGRVKLVITSGVFMDNKKSPADLLIVGEYIRKAPLSKIVKAIEAEIGKEIRYSIFETEDFKYRVAVYDKFVREILDFPHKKILDKLYN